MFIIIPLKTYLVIINYSYISVEVNSDNNKKYLANTVGGKRGSI